jgi:predicted GNAT family acetyltransferase
MSYLPEASSGSRIKELREDEKDEALNFLSTRPLHTVYLASLIHDNGVNNPRNRGSFYTSRTVQGDMEGLALIGHATIVETQNDSALMAFARVARNCQSHLIRGEQEMIQRFWTHYAISTHKRSVLTRELLMVNTNSAFIDREPIDLRKATISDLEYVLSVNAALVFQECGVNPLRRDPNGFRQRTTRRIEQGRIWVWLKDNRLMFKADIVAETPQVIYLEGVHVHQEERRRGYGLRCLTQLCAQLFERTESICLTISEKNKKVQQFYEKAGFEFHSDYQTIYLR